MVGVGMPVEVVVLGGALVLVAAGGGTFDAVAVGVSGGAAC